MHDLQDKNWPRLDEPYDYNGGLSGWIQQPNKHEPVQWHEI
jgi:hypothetical protein